MNASLPFQYWCGLLVIPDEVHLVCMPFPHSKQSIWLSDAGSECRLLRIIVG
ncbi:hypothetical protein DENSPDRAFT_834168 [Dentipellis sp. KUC8613]|nr:hypothetical protein DENSPDRAFT_834168 [Dentipellis sp. KUC8613]